MLEIVLLVLKGLLPAVAAALLLVGVFGNRCVGLAIATGVLTGYALLKQEFPPWPPDLLAGNNDAVQWLLWCGVAAGLLALTGDRRSLRWVLVPAGLLLFAAQVWLMLRNRTGGMEPGAAWLLRGGVAAAALFVWLPMRRAAARRPDVGPAMVWTGCLFVDSILLILGHSALGAQLAGAATAALGTAAVTALWRRPFAIEQASTLPIAVFHIGLLLIGNQLADLPLAPALLAALAPATLALAPPPRPGEGKSAFIAVALVAATLLGAALGLCTDPG